MGENPNFQNFSYYPITDKQELGTKNAWIIQDKIKATYGQLHAAIQRGDWTHMVNLSNQYANPFHIVYAPDRLQLNKNISISTKCPEHVWISISHCLRTRETPIH